MKENHHSLVVLSNRIRLARNLESISFPQGLSPENSQIIERKVANVLESIEVSGEKLKYYSLKDLTSLEQYVLIEKHLISPALVNSQGAHGVALNADHKISVMVNEEDHLRLQVLLPGSKLKETYELANELDDEIEKYLDIAYREAQGYLTACPTNVGTGMRASVMVHLPALVITNQIQQILGALTHLGLAVRGLYGEGSKSHGNLFQVSNQITLGKSEEDIITHLEAVTSQIEEHEMQAREKLQREAPLTLEDKVWRARGILENSRLLTSEEAMQLLSMERLGIDLGILPRHRQSFTTLFADTLPYTLQYFIDQELDSSERDQQRAKVIRQAIMEV